MKDLKRGAVHLIGDLKENMVVKFGIDPTACDVHLGHIVMFKKLRDFASAGHQVKIIIGNFTAAIGDPSGRDKTRPMLDMKEIQKNHGELLGEIIFFFHEPSAVWENVEILENLSWFGDMKPARLIEAMSSFTVAQMLERNAFSERFKNQTPISLQEFVYPVLQGLDSVELKADLELGGTDQLFNLTAGRKIMEMWCKDREPQSVMTLPLLVGTDGVNKMSKTLNNHISVREPKSVMRSKIINIPDTLIENWMTLLTDIPEKEIKKLLKDPIKAKIKLADDIIKLLKKEDEANTTIEVEAKPLWSIVKELMDVSGSEARRLIQQGAVSFDGIKNTNENWEVQTGKLKVGKHFEVQLNVK